MEIFLAKNINILVIVNGMKRLLKGVKQSFTRERVIPARPESHYVISTMMSVCEHQSQIVVLNSSFRLPSARFSKAFRDSGQARVTNERPSQISHN